MVSRPDRGQDEETLTVELIENGSAIAGAATGAPVGLVGGPLGVVGGAALGAALGGVLKRVGAEIRQRVLGPRDRNDGFFEVRDADRPPAEEILEGVLQKARDAYEERKLRLLGLLYANVAFHPEISPQHANYLIALAGQLTYRQLVALAIAHHQVRHSRRLLGRAQSRRYTGAHPLIGSSRSPMNGPQREHTVQPRAAGIPSTSVWAMIRLLEAGELEPPHTDDFASQPRLSARRSG